LEQMNGFTPILQGTIDNINNKVVRFIS
jgi:hypothetical protein